VITAKKIDEIDTKILKDLLIEGRKELRKIAREAKVSKDIIWQHYNNMKKEGIILGATIQVNYAALGYDVAASFFIDVPPSEQHQVAEQLRKIPGLHGSFRWGSPSRLWAVAEMIKASRIEAVKESINSLSSVRKVEVEVWTGSRNQPENLSILDNSKISSGTERTEIQHRRRIKETAVKIDETDRQIIEKLVVDGREPFSSIGKELGISTNTVIRRYNKLKRNGIVRALIQINPTKIGYLAMVCFRLMVGSQGNLDSIVEKMAKIPDVFGIIKTTGIFEVAIFTATKDLAHFFALETEIAGIPGILEMETATIDPYTMLPSPGEHISTF
jgi:Lrp/AsnC family transcriptional regulator for asnA, asnC and gidA